MRFSIRHLLVLTIVVSIGITISVYQPKTKWEKMDVKVSLDRLVAALNKHHPEVKADQIHGLSPARLAKLKKDFPEAPPQLFALLERYDFSGANLLYPIDLLGPDTFKSGIQEQIDFFDDVGHDDLPWTPDRYGYCKVDKNWRENWIPLGQFNGDPVFIDMDPTEKGVSGQIVRIYTDGWGLDVEAYSLAHWLERIAENVERGKMGPGDYMAFVYDELEPASEEK